MILIVELLRALAWALQVLAAPFLALSWLSAWIARPILWCARRCQDCAREWDPRL